MCIYLIHVRGPDFGRLQKYQVANMGTVLLREAISLNIRPILCTHNRFFMQIIYPDNFPPASSFSLSHSHCHESSSPHRSLDMYALPSGIPWDSHIVHV